jgi:HEAT repeat protein
VEAVQGQRDFVEKLIAALDHPEPETRARAALNLGLRGDARGVEPLMRVVCRSEDPSLVEVAIEALARIGDARCHKVAEAALSRGALRVWRAAREPFASLGAPMECNDERR